ncbi:MAG: class I SAM-dependent methyltransferase [Candidatus Paceibacterota bacterium]|jgi:hypothetical protein
MKNKFLVSRMCTEKEFFTPEYNFWCEKIKEPPRTHRKQDEFVMICQALRELGMLQEGKEGLGFAIGEEPLPALFASLGCNILATDLPLDDKRSKAWHETRQTCTIASLNSRGICPPDEFEQRVKYRPVDMNDMPDDLGLYDFCWSACSLEHLGSLEKGKQHLDNIRKFIKPGGSIVVTFEYNLSSDNLTVATGDTVLFRKKDVINMIERAREGGFKTHGVSWEKGEGFLDNHVDVPPYSGDNHIKLQIGQYVCTSFILILSRI